MSLEANIRVQSKSHTMLLPSEFLQNDGTVWLENGDQRKVEVGLRDYNWVEILSGLDTSLTVTQPK